ncbi:MAG: type IV pilus assembly protein PilM [Patescibacteria group bacterium]
MPALAIDIGTYTIKAIQADGGKKPRIRRVIEVFNSTGLAVPTDDAVQEKLKLILKAVIENNKFTIDDVRLALPETVVSTKVIEVLPLTDAELASAIGWQAERHIPIPPEELSLEYQVLYRPGKDEKTPMKVLLVGVRKSIIERYVGMFHQIGVEPTVVETQILSVIRALQIGAEDPPTLLVHFGASSIIMAIVDHQQLKFVVNQMMGSQILTKTLEKTVNIDASQAEQYKRAYGLDPAQFEGKIKAALLPQINELVAQIKKAVQFYGSQVTQNVVKRIVLSGGACQLPGFVQYVTEQLSMEVLVSSPFSATEGTVPENINHPGMTVCVGLLMRES